uniref:Uncharacterized protein n=1 Tax=Amphiprion ocellaris TaxID=80972 RepID=A0A3Q1B3V7_AMPOC
MLKTFSVAVAVVLSFIFIQESSAVPVMKVSIDLNCHELVSFGNPSAAHKVKFAESGKVYEVIYEGLHSDLKYKPYCYPTRDGVFCRVTCRLEFSTIKSDLDKYFFAFT